MTRALPISLALATAVVVAGCRDTNITDPAGSDASGMIVFASNRLDNNYEIYRVAANGSGLRRLTTSRMYSDRAPVLSTDGRRIAWEREISTPNGDITAVEIWSMAVDGSDARPLVQNGSFNRSPSWGPDGELVFASRVSGSDQIYRIAAGATAAVRLTTSGAADQHPRISPDGRRIVFQSNRDLDFDVYVMSADGGSVENLTRYSGDDRFPAWTPDGARIVWTRFDDATLTFDILGMPAAGGTAAPIIATSFNELAPSVSPDGTSIVYQTDRSPPFALYIAPLAGGEGRPLRVGDLGRSSDLGPWWGPSR